MKTTKRAAAKAEYDALQAQVRAAAWDGDVAEVERLNVLLNRAWRRMWR